MSVKGWWEESQEQTERRLPVAGANLREESSWLDVHADQEYVLQVSLRRINMGQQRVSMPNTNTFYQVTIIIMKSVDKIQLCEMCIC